MGIFDNVTYSDDAAGRAAKERNDAISVLTDLQDNGGAAGDIHAATLKVAAAAQQFNVVLSQPRTPVASPAPVARPRPAPSFPKFVFPTITSKIVAVPTGEPITTAVLTAIATVFSIFGFGTTSAIKKAVEAIRTALKDISNTLMNIIWTFAHNIRWVLNALRWVWEKVLSPLIDEINDLVSRVAQIITKILKPYLDLIQKIRRHILEIYVRFFLPVIKVIQQMRVMISILKLLHVPGMKALDEKLARIEGKLIGVIQVLLSRVNDHGGLLNILMTARMTIQHGILIRSMYETQGAWVNQWWNAQEWDRSAADEEAAVQLDLKMQARPHEQALDTFLRTGVDTSGDVPGPHEQELDALLRQGAA